jgi:hypothetical protein
MTGAQPDGVYTQTWSPDGELQFAQLSGGTRLRYLRTGSGPTQLVLLHGRANRVAAVHVGGARLPAVGPLVTTLENKPVRPLCRARAADPRRRDPAGTRRASRAEPG